MIRLKNHQLQSKCDELQGKCDELQGKCDELQEDYDDLQGDYNGLDEKWKMNMDMYKITGCYYDVDTKIDYGVNKRGYEENIIDPIIDY